MEYFYFFVSFCKEMKYSLNSNTKVQRKLGKENLCEKAQEKSVTCMKTGKAFIEISVKNEPQSKQIFPYTKQRNLA